MMEAQSRRLIGLSTLSDDIVGLDHHRDNVII